MLSFDEKDLLVHESDNDGSDSGSADMYPFPFHFDESVDSVGDSVGRVDEYVGCVSGVGSVVIVPTGNESIGAIVPLVVFVSKGVKYKGGGLIKIFWRPKSA